MIMPWPSCKLSTKNGRLLCKLSVYIAILEENDFLMCLRFGSESGNINSKEANCNFQSWVPQDNKLCGRKIVDLLLSQWGNFDCWVFRWTFEHSCHVRVYAKERKKAHPLKAHRKAANNLRKVSGRVVWWDQRKLAGRGRSQTFDGGTKRGPTECVNPHVGPIARTYVL